MNFNIQFHFFPCLLYLRRFLFVFQLSQFIIDAIFGDCMIKCHLAMFNVENRIESVEMECKTLDKAYNKRVIVCKNVHQIDVHSVLLYFQCPHYSVKANLSANVSIDAFCSVYSSVCMCECALLFHLIKLYGAHNLKLISIKLNKTKRHTITQQHTQTNVMWVWIYWIVVCLFSILTFSKGNVWHQFKSNENCFRRIEMAFRWKIAWWNQMILHLYSLYDTICERGRHFK